MNNFTQVQIYCKYDGCCFDDIQKSSKPFITININEISTLGYKEDWGFCNKYWKYPYRKLKMNNGDTYLCVIESADELDKKLLENNK